MTTEHDDYVDEDFEEMRRRWEGIHDDEAAQHRVLFEDSSSSENLACCVLPGAVITAVCLAASYGLYKLATILF